MLLAVEHLRVMLRADQQPLVDDLSFSLGEGQSLIILGQSGCGKTLTCKTIMGILDERSFVPEGRILFDGEDLLALSGARRRKINGAQIAMIPQNPMTSLDPSMRIGRQMQETLGLHSPLRGAALRRATAQSLRDAGLTRVEDILKSYPYMLSGGMLQRVLIAMALMVNARLIVADEPTTALDAEHRRGIVDCLVALRNAGTAVLLVTHDFAVASRMGGPLLVMKDGRAVERGRIDRVLASPQHPYTRELIEASRLSGWKGANAAC